MAQEKMGFGFISDNDEALQSKSFGTFGLNQRCKITTLEFNPNGGANGSEADCIDFKVVNPEGKEFNARLYDITGDVYNKAGMLVSEEDETYNEGYNAKWVQNSAWLTHIVKSVGITEAQIQKALSTKIDSFKQWAEIMCDLAKDKLAETRVDIFLEYQSKIGKNNTITFLQIPPNMKGGYFICPHVVGENFIPLTHEEHGLKYKDAKGNEHPFTRNSRYMESFKAIQQKEGEDSEEEDENFREENTSTKEDSSNGEW